MDDNNKKQPEKQSSVQEAVVQNDEIIEDKLISKPESAVAEVQTNNTIDFQQSLIKEMHQSSKQVKEYLKMSFADIMTQFEQKLAYDISKQQQIDRLHHELQQYRTDLIAKTNRPFVNGITHMHDDIGKLVESLKAKSNEYLTADRFFKILENLQDDIEILLDQNGVMVFREIGNTFQPRRQQVLRKIETSDELAVGHVAAKIRPGFEQGDELIRKERVAVYILNKNQSKQSDESMVEKT